MPKFEYQATLNHAALKRSQRIHAWVIFLVPPLGVAAAVALSMHIGVSWFDVALLLTMYFATFTGITVGFHRLLTHRSFQAGAFVKAVLIILGSMAAQGPALYWVSNHRRHHLHSDQPGDPHSPHHNGEKKMGRMRGLWHAQVGWTYRHELTNTLAFAKDLLRDPLVSKLNQTYFVWVFLGLALPAAAGAIHSGSILGAASGFLWGGLVRLFLSYHAANSINSVTHLFGSRPFNTREQSRNNIWLALPTCGEAWHNNHHAFPHSAFFGMKWWQLDLGGLVVRILEKLGLAHNVNRPTRDLIDRRTRDPQEERDFPDPSVSN